MATAALPSCEIRLEDTVVGVAVVISRTRDALGVLQAKVWISGMGTWHEFFVIHALSLADGDVSVATWNPTSKTDLARMFRAVSLTAAWRERERVRAGIGLVLS